MSPLTLREIGRFTARGGDIVLDEFAILYEASGMPPNNYCLIGYAGMRDDERRWGVSWFRSGERVNILSEDTYTSPEKALEAIARALVN